MSITHLHLLLNHVPVVGIVGLAALYALAAWRRSAELAKVALGLTVALAGIAVAVYFTGEPAEELVERLPGFDEGLVERHEDAAMVATIALATLGLAATALLARYRRRALPNGIAMLGLAASLVTSALLGWTANLGGQIRHTEIRGAAVADAPRDSDGGAARRQDP